MTYSTPARRSNLSAPLAVLAALAVVAVLVIAVWGSGGGQPTLNDRVKAVATQLRCPICQGESVWDSPSALAGNMRTIIRQQLRQGRSEAQVEAYFESRYQAWILLEPPSSGIGSLAWILPPAALLLGLGVLLWASRSWLRHRRQVAKAELSSSEDFRWALERLDDQLDDGTIDADTYDQRREALEREVRRPTPWESTDPGNTSRRPLLQAGAMLATAVVIAASISLAVQQRGSAAITGTVPQGSSPAPAPSTKLPPKVTAAVRFVFKHPHRTYAWMRAGALLLNDHQLPAAAFAFQKAVSISPDDLQARLELAFVDLSLPGNSGPKDAVRVLKSMTSTHPSSARLWLIEALANQRIPGETAKVTADFRRYLRAAPNGPLNQLARQWITRHEAAK